MLWQTLLGLYVLATDPITHSNPNMHCTSCEGVKYSTPGSIIVKCTYKELRQTAKNGCPRCAFVSAWIGVWVDYLNITDSTRILAFEFGSECNIYEDGGKIILDLFKMNSETGEYLHHYKFRSSPSNCTLSEVAHSTTYQDEYSGMEENIILTGYRWYTASVQDQKSRPKPSKNNKLTHNPKNHRCLAFTMHQVTHGV